MNEFEEKLNAILSDPGAMAQVMHLAQSLDLGGGSPPPAEHEEQPAEPPPPSSPQPPAGTAGLEQLLGQVDPSLLGRLLPLAGELMGGGQEGDQRLELLRALRPFLSPRRQEKVEQAAKAARLIRLGKTFLTTLGDAHV